MDSVGMDGIWQLAEVIDKAASKNVTNNATLQATVTRVDNEGTAWVHIPGGAEETPINGLNTAEVQPGDVVGVSIAGNQASITGNATAPSVSQRTIQAAVAPVQRQAEEAKKQAEIAEKIASEVEAVSGDTNNHFWDDSNGAHVTDVEKDEWLAAVEDGFTDYNEETKPYRNVLVGRLGILLRSCLNNLVGITRSAISFFDGQGNEASNIVASFGSDGARIGKLADTHVMVDSDSLDIVDGETILSTFTDNGAELGKNSDRAQIDFCNGKGLITSSRLGEGDESLNFVSGAVTTYATRPTSGSYVDEDGYVRAGLIKFGDGRDTSAGIYNQVEQAIVDDTTVDEWSYANNATYGQVYQDQYVEADTGVDPEAGEEEGATNSVNSVWAASAGYTKRDGGNWSGNYASLFMRTYVSDFEEQPSVAELTADRITLDAGESSYLVNGAVVPTLIPMGNAPSTTVWSGVLGWRDYEDQNYPAYLQANKNASGIQTLTLGARTVSSSGKNQSHTFGLSVSQAGVKSVTLDQAPWLAALGLASKTVSGTNAFNVASGFTLSSAQLVTAGNVAQLYIAVVKTAAAAANTEYTVGTIASASSMKPVATAAGTANARAATTWLRVGDGQVRLRPEVAYAANTAFWLSFTFIPTSWT